MSNKLRVFVDADVLFAGAASSNEYSASLLVLRLSELTIIDAITSEQAVSEAERNLQKKIPRAMPAFRHLVARSLKITAAPVKSELYDFRGMADAKDLPILVAAIKSGCGWLVTFNVRHFQPGHPDITVLRPGEFVQRTREQLVYMP